MRFGIPLLADRVAPRCTFADSVLVVSMKGRRIWDEWVVPLNGTTWADLSETLTSQEVDTLICGGISRETRESVRARDVRVIANVAGTRDEVLEALGRGTMRPGFGLGPDPAPGKAAEKGPAEELSRIDHSIRRRKNSPPPSANARPTDCLECATRVCLEGRPCPFLELPVPQPADEGTSRVLEATWDVALEEERTLCRIAELVYFALEMGYRRLGVAFCEDLREPAGILTGVLRRFFDVVAVGCKARGREVGSPSGNGGEPTGASRNGDEPGSGNPGREVPCDPSYVAEVLNSRETELNVLVGFCVGADSVFCRCSYAPVTTVFLKDKSLANNPIGAVYSHYYLEDI